MAKPTVVIVHGLIFGPGCYSPLQQALERQGFDVVVPRLPSLGEGVVNATIATEIAAVRAAMAPAMEDDRDILLVGHSYGGLIITPAAQGFTRQERKARGEKGGVKWVVYMEAFASFQRGGHPLDLLFGCGSGLPAMMPRLEIDGQPTDNILVTDTEIGKQGAQFMFFNTCTAEQMDACFPHFESMSLGAALETTSVIPADLEVASLTYIIGEKDNAMTVPVAEKYAAGTPGMKTVRIDTGHAPFISHVDELVQVLEHIASE